MPVYEYKCLKCEKPFTLIERIAERHKVKCPACGSTVVERVYGAFFAKTSKKS